MAGDDIHQFVAVQGPGIQDHRMVQPMRPWGTDDLGELPPDLCGQPCSTENGHSPVEGSLTDFETDADYLSILMVRPALLHAGTHIILSQVMQSGCVGGFCSPWNSTLTCKLICCRCIFSAWPITGVAGTYCSYVRFYHAKHLCGMPVQTISIVIWGTLPVAAWMYAVFSVGGMSACVMPEK